MTNNEMNIYEKIFHLCEDFIFMLDEIGEDWRYHLLRDMEDSKAYIVGEYVYISRWSEVWCNGKPSTTRFQTYYIDYTHNIGDVSLRFNENILTNPKLATEHYEDLLNLFNTCKPIILEKMNEDVKKKIEDDIKYHEEKLVKLREQLNK